MATADSRPPQAPKEESVKYDEFLGFSGILGVLERLETIPEPLLVLPIAALVDYLIGDPWGWVHPVQVMGWVIQRYSQWAIARWQEPREQRWAGIGLAGVLVVGSGAIAFFLIHISQWLHPLLGIAVQGVLLASCLAGRSLRGAAEEVLRPLEAGDLTTARSKLALYVGRDTDELPEPEILRAVLETVTENATDGVMAPLFWAIVGSFTPLGAVPGAIAFKAASTLDSMVGYRTAPYAYLGTASARLDDCLTWLPCRLTVLTIALLSGRPRPVLKLCRRDAPQDPSPNAGWSECVYAAALGVQVGGRNVYRGEVKQKPLLGNPDRPITPSIIRQAMQLTRIAFLLWLGLALLPFAIPKNIG